MFWHAKKTKSQNLQNCFEWCITMSYLPLDFPYWTALSSKWWYCGILEAAKSRDGLVVASVGLYCEIARIKETLTVTRWSFLQEKKPFCLTFKIAWIGDDSGEFFQLFQSAGHDLLRRALQKGPSEFRGKSVQQVHPQEVILISGFSQKRKKQDGGRSELNNCGGNRRRKGLICPNSFGTLSGGGESSCKHCIFSQDFNFKARLLLPFQSVKAILDRGVDANSCSPEGFRPICIAAFWGYNGIVQLLLNRG